MDDRESPEDLPVERVPIKTVEEVSADAISYEIPESGVAESTSIADIFGASASEESTGQGIREELWPHAKGFGGEPSPPPAPSRSPQNQFRVGTVLSLTFVVLGKNPLLYLILATMACLPGIIIELSYDVIARSHYSFFFIQQAVDIFVSMIFMGAIAYSVYQDLVGGRARFWDAIAAGLRRYFSLIVISIVTLFLLAISVIFAAICIAFIGLLGLLTAILFFRVLCVYAVSVPVCVAEGIGPFASLDRSSSLTKGHRMGVFGLIIVYIIVVVVSGLIVGFAFPDMSNGVNTGLLLIRPFLTAFQEVMVATLYFQLRVDKEGVSVDKLVQVFD